jgi:hypothetical protein
MEGMGRLPDGEMDILKRIRALVLKLQNVI